MPVRTLRLLLPALLLLGARPAAAEDVDIPILVLEEGAAVDSGGGSTDLGDLVLGAAKRIISVQEVPAIVTVLTAERIRELRPTQLAELIELVPGWRRFDPWRGAIPSALPRGTLQSLLIFRDGIPLVDLDNFATMSPIVPLEMMKRVEVVTGPGGVLWGANSFLGQINLITKDAEDVDGIETTASVGAGVGEPGRVRASVLAGFPKIVSSKIRGLFFVAFQRSEVADISMPLALYDAPIPRPPSPMLYGPMTLTDAPASTYLNLDGKLSLGSLDVVWSWPYVNRSVNMTFGANPIVAVRPEDSLPECARLEPEDPRTLDPTDRCYDIAYQNRRQLVQFADRYVIADWKHRSSLVRTTAKAYYADHMRLYDPVSILPPIKGLLEGGVALRGGQRNERAGTMLDFDIHLGRRAGLLAGLEFAHEWVSDFANAPGFEDGERGNEYLFVTPYDLGKLPNLCPLRATWDESTGKPTDVEYYPNCPTIGVYAVNRSVVAGFANANLRLTDRLLLDGGLRLQAAPAALGDISYDPVPLASGTLNYQLVRDWYLKFNVAQGFRPPKLYDMGGNAAVFNMGTDPNIDVETSIAYTGELIGRALRNRRQIRVLDVRIDYSYSRLDDLIQQYNGVSRNYGARGIHSAEALSALHLKGGHSLEAAYNYLRIESSDAGRLTAIPANWLRLTAVANAWARRVQLLGTLAVGSASENPNRRIDVSQLEYGADGQADVSDPNQVTRVTASEQVLDRVPPWYLLQVGARYKALDGKLDFDVMLYNALNARAYMTDVQSEVDGRFQQLPVALDTFRIIATATYRL